MTRSVGNGRIRTVTFDFGNTLLPVDPAGLVRVVDRTADAIVERLGPFDRDAVLAACPDERDRQLAEEVPRYREDARRGHDNGIVADLEPDGLSGLGVALA